MLSVTSGQERKHQGVVAASGSAWAFGVSGMHGVRLALGSNLSVAISPHQMCDFGEVTLRAQASVLLSVEWGAR